MYQDVNVLSSLRLILCIIVFYLLLLLCFNGSSHDMNSLSLIRNEIVSGGETPVLTNGLYMFDKEPTSEHGTMKYYLKLSDSGASVYFSEALNILVSESDLSLRSLMTNTFKNIEFDGYFWECPPISYDTLSTVPFQFIIKPTHFLNSVEVDSQSFSEHFNNQNNNFITIFPSLGNDAILLAPKPLSSNKISIYTHIAIFCKEAPIIQIDTLWKQIANTLLHTNILKDFPSRKIWMSTSGLGVSWLHVRLDTYPKYYQWNEYRNG
mmetsp:Transcript_37094/g.37770  ORF Transcript_37094/g.37770 Transcript_37094/m.37770 type:complete len:265 (+) Transcript_37094:185-979(+)